LQSVKTKFIGLCRNMWPLFFLKVNVALPDWKNFIVKLLALNLAILTCVLTTRL